LCPRREGRGRREKEDSDRRWESLLKGGGGEPGMSGRGGGAMVGESRWLRSAREEDRLASYE
jgi:hypothetical protein